MRCDTTDNAYDSLLNVPALCRYTEPAEGSFCLQIPREEGKECMDFTTLNAIRGPEDVKKLPLEKLPELAAEMREALFHRITPECICEDVAAKCLR